MSSYRVHDGYCLFCSFTKDRNRSSWLLSYFTYVLTDDAVNCETVSNKNIKFVEQERYQSVDLSFVLIILYQEPIVV